MACTPSPALVFVRRKRCRHAVDTSRTIFLAALPAMHCTPEGLATGLEFCGLATGWDSHSLFRAHFEVQCSLARPCAPFRSSSTICPRLPFGRVLMQWRSSISESIGEVVWRTVGFKLLSAIVAQNRGRLKIWRAVASCCLSRADGTRGRHGGEVRHEQGAAGKTEPVAFWVAPHSSGRPKHKPICISTNQFCVGCFGSVSGVWECTHCTGGIARGACFRVEHG